MAVSGTLCPSLELCYSSAKSLARLGHIIDIHMACLRIIIVVEEQVDDVLPDLKLELSVSMLELLDVPRGSRVLEFLWPKFRSRLGHRRRVPAFGARANCVLQRPCSFPSCSEEPSHLIGRLINVYMEPQP